MNPGRDEYGHPIQYAAYSDLPSFSTSMADLYGSGIFVDSSEPQGAKQANKGSKVNAAAADEGSGSVGGPRHVRFGGRVVEEHLSGVTANDQYTEAERRGAAYEMADAAAHERV